MSKWRWKAKDSAVDGADIVGFVGEGTVFNGDLVLKGGARVDGKIVGTIDAPSLLIVGPNGDIDAKELRAHKLVVCGTVRGNLTVTDRLEIQPGGRVSGRVVMEKEGLVVAPGGIFEGMVEHTKERRANADSHNELSVEALIG